jgi:hypothetical protein
MDVNQKNNKKVSKVPSTELSIEDYNTFLTLTKLEYKAGLIKEEESSSGLLRFTLHRLLNQLRNNPIYHLLEEQQLQQLQQQLQQDKAQN